MWRRNIVVACSKWEFRVAFRKNDYEGISLRVQNDYLQLVLMQ